VPGESGSELEGRGGRRAARNDPGVVEQARQGHQPWIDHHSVQEHVDVRVELAIAVLLEPAIVAAHGVTPS
jgi:hypothetical protein